MVARDATFVASYNSILTRAAGVGLDRRASCAKNSLSPCCGPDGCKSRDNCYPNCGSDGANAGGAGCVLGKYLKAKCLNDIEIVHRLPHGLSCEKAVLNHIMFGFPLVELQVRK
jgi:hypothetical protein